MTRREIEVYGDLDRKVTSTWHTDGTRKFNLSDRRHQSVTRPCLLCGQIKLLRLSHVHPSWTGKFHRAEGGFVSGYRGVTGPEVHLEQDFAKHYLLCADCEQLLSISENYVRRLSHGQPKDLQDIGVRLDATNLVTGLDRGNVLTFIASFLLRSHGAVSAPHIRLPHHLVSELQSAILERDFAPSRHLLHIGKVISSIPGANPLAVAIRSVERKGSTLKFEVVLGGLYWIYLVRPPSASQRWQRDELRQFLESDAVGQDSARISPVPLSMLNIVKRDQGLSVDVELEEPPLELDTECVCGWGVGTLRECCGQTWLLGHLLAAGSGLPADPTHDATSVEGPAEI